MGWLFTGPLLLIVVSLVMRLDDSVFKAKAKTLGVGSALILVSGYGELARTGDPTPHRACWFLPCSSSSKSFTSCWWT